MRAAPDGSPVGLYAVLPPGPELELVVSRTPAGGRVLDLGCGAGRLSDALADHGFDVVGVDESGDMLECIRWARTVEARIEGLVLGEDFDTVVLASHLVHLPSRPALLDTCRRHVRPGGVVLIQRYDPGWVRRAEAGERERDGVRFVLRDVSREGLDILHAVIEYHWPDGTAAHAFTAVAVEDAVVESWLRDAGLRPVGWHDESWVEATR